MAVYLRAPAKTFATASAIARHLRVKLDSDGRVSVAGAADHDIGTAARTANAEDDEIAIELASLEGTAIYIASATIAVGATVYGAAAGKVNTTNTGVPVGIALSAGVSDGEIEVLRRAITPPSS